MIFVFCFLQWFLSITPIARFYINKRKIDLMSCIENLNIKTLNDIKNKRKREFTSCIEI